MRLRWNLMTFKLERENVTKRWLIQLFYNFIFIILSGVKILSVIRCSIAIRFNPPVTISLSDRLGHFFQSGFWSGPPVTIPRSHRPGFFHFFFIHIFDPEHQWLYYGLTDRVFLNLVCETVVWSLTSRCKMSLKKKTPVWQTVVWSLGGC